MLSQSQHRRLIKIIFHNLNIVQISWQTKTFEALKSIQSDNI